MDVEGWLRERGYWLRGGGGGGSGGQHPTHLFLTGGKAAVPDDSAATFLTAYANAIVRGDTPSISECRTPVFRLFVDLDACVKTEEDAARVRDVVVAIARRAPLFFDVDGEDAAVVVLQAPLKRRGDLVKSGTHLVWPRVFADAATALEFRDGVVARLEEDFGTLFENDWQSIVDSAVYRSSGLRMVWSHKGSEGRPYVPRATVSGSGEWTDVSVPDRLTVAFAREWVRATSIRAPGASPTGLRAGIVVTRSSSAGGLDHAVAASVAQYAAALDKIDAMLPLEHAGQKFVAVLELDSCFILRSTSRYCANLGRPHNTNNVYFVLSRRGLSQHCYCRCETTEGRRRGMCRDFAGPTWPLPADVLREFFGDDVESQDHRHDLGSRDEGPPPIDLPPLPPPPSARTGFADLGTLLRASQRLPPPKTKKRAAART